MNTTLSFPHFYQSDCHRPKPPPTSVPPVSLFWLLDLCFISGNTTPLFCQSLRVPGNTTRLFCRSLRVPGNTTLSFCESLRVPGNTTLSFCESLRVPRNTTLLFCESLRVPADECVVFPAPHRQSTVPERRRVRCLFACGSVSLFTKLVPSSQCSSTYTVYS